MSGLKSYYQSSDSENDQAKKFQRKKLQWNEKKLPRVPEDDLKGNIQDVPLAIVKKVVS